MSAILYDKTCKYSGCGREFQSKARNTRYCCVECRELAQIENRKKKARNKKRRNEYDKNKELERLVARCYALSRDIMEFVMPAPDDGEEYELHHYQLDPFNCSPLNMAWVKRDKHEQYHTVLPTADAIFVLKELMRNPEYLLRLHETYEEMLENKELDANKFTVMEFLGKDLREVDS